MFSSNLVESFRRYAELKAEIWPVSLPLSFGTPLPMFPLEFRGEVSHEQTRVMGLSFSEDPMIMAGVILNNNSMRQRYVLTDGRTDGFTIGPT